MRKDNENIGAFMQMLFKLDWKTPINRRVEYSHSFFFQYRRMSDFLLSVFNQMMNRKFWLSEKQTKVIQDFIKKNYLDIVSSFHNSISAPMIVAKAGYGDVEGQRIAQAHYDKEEELKKQERKEELELFMKSKGLREGN